MAFDVHDEIVDIRERLARIETNMAILLKRIDAQPEPINRGQIVIPVTVVVALVELIRVGVERFT